MKRILAIACLLGLLCVGVAWGWMNVGTAGGGASAAPAGPTYLASYDFEEAGTPSGVTVALGTPDFDYATAPAPLVGSESARLAGCSDAEVKSYYHEFTPTDGQSQYFYRVVNITAKGSASGAYDTHATFFNSSTGLAYFNTTDAGATTAGFSVLAFGGTVVAMVATVEIPGTVHIWGKYTKGSGTDAVAEMRMSTDGTFPSCPSDNCAVSSDGTRTVDADRLRSYGDYGSATNCWDLIVDKERVDDAPIGSNPQ